MTNRIPKNYVNNMGFLSVKKMKKKKNNKNKKKIKKKESEEILEEDRIFQLMPSKTGGVESTIPETLDQLTEEALAMKKHLETHPMINSNLSQFLMYCVDYVIRMVHRYCNVTNYPPFNWKTKKFPKWFLKERSLKYRSGDFSSRDVEDSYCIIAKNASNVLPCFEFHGLAQVNSVTGSETVKAYASRPPLFDPNRILLQSVSLSLNEKEKKIWLEFKMFDKGYVHPDIELKDFKEAARSIGLGHPIVSVIGDFSVVAFNEACEMHVKKDEHNNLHDVEYMECKYLKLNEVYHFYMTIEAIEEGNLGVYETGVVCTSDGNMLTVTKFVLTGHKPIGTKAMAISIFSFLRCVCKTMEGVTEEKTIELSKILDVINGLHQLLSLGHQLLFSPDCNRTTNPDVWSHVGHDLLTGGMVHRTKGTPCRGYDYHHPLFRSYGHY